MNAQSFDAVIVNGHMVPSKSLEAFEGQRVHVTLTLPEPTVNKPSENDPDTAEDKDVEKDVSVRMPFPSKLLPDRPLIQEGSLKPCVILCEELPDE